MTTDLELKEIRKETRRKVALLSAGARARRDDDDVTELTYTDPQHRLGWLQCFAGGDHLPGTDPGDPLNWALHNIANELLALRAELADLKAASE